MADWTPPDKPVEAGTWKPPDAPVAAAETPAKPPVAEEQPSLVSRIIDEGLKNPLVSLPVNVGPPVVNALVADPIRNLAADVVGGVRSPPFSEAGREGFYEQREKSLKGTSGLRLPETETGEKVSWALGLPGQAISGLVGALGDATGTREMLGPAATVAGDVLPLAGGLAGALRGRAPTPSAMVPRPQAAAARAAGYKLSPEYISESPGLPARLLSGDTGRIKKHQSFSQANQQNTNALAAKSIGLPPETMLNDAAFKKARQPAADAYEAIRTEAPETVLGADPEFRQAVQNVGVRSAELEEAFPEMTGNPSIDSLRNQLLQNGVQSTDLVIKKIADLRGEAGKNYRSAAATERSLGFAQRQAADVLEDAIEKSIGYGPLRIEAFKAREAAAQRLFKEQTAAAERGGTAEGRIPEALDEFAKAEAALKTVRGLVTPAEIAKAEAATQRFRAARQLFAKTYDVESATNLATGDVLARRIGALRGRLKRPLSGELKQIADSYDAHPRDMQSPAAFGYAEDFSVLDVVAGLSAASAGHPTVAAAVAGRPLSRALLKSAPVQRHMFNRQPVMSSSGAGVAAGEALMPHEDDGVARMFGP